jgi:hypothetical protein
MTDPQETVPVPTPDVAGMDLDQLDATVETYAQQASFTPAEFTHYLQADSALEAQLYGLAMASSQEFEFTVARRILSRLVEINTQIRAVAERQLADADDDDFRALLDQARDEAIGYALLCQGQQALCNAGEWQVNGDLLAANDALEQAMRYFGELADSALPQAGVGQLYERMSRSKTAFNVAVLAMRAGRYDQATDEFRQTLAGFGVLQDQLLAEMPDVTEQDVPAATVINELLEDLRDNIVYTQMALKFVEFFSQINAGNYEDAVAYATDTVTLAERWLNTAVSRGAAVPVINVRRMENEQYHGWLAWAESELQIEQRAWDECRAKIREARDRWASSNDIALRHALLGVTATKIDTGNTEMLLQSTLRRCKKEKQLWEQIEQLHEEKRQALVVNQYAGDRVKHDESSTYNFQGNVTAGAIGSGARSQGDHVESHHNPVTTTDLPQLADQLADLAEAMNQGARGDNEQTAVEVVRQAEVQARQGNEHGAMERLRQAGGWALSIAGKLGLAAAEAAIKAAIGA